MRTRVVMIGCGRGGKALLELFKQDPTVSILGVADNNPSAIGLDMAKGLTIPVSKDYRELFKISNIDLIIDVSGSPEVRQGIQELKPDQAEVMGGGVARFLSTLLEERRQKAELKKRYELAMRDVPFHADRDFVIGESQRMKVIADLIRKVAPHALNCSHPW